MIAATCGALAGMGGIVGFIWIAFPRGKARLSAWVHEVSGADGVRDQVIGVINEIAGLREDMTALTSTVVTNHQEGLAKFAEVDTRHETLSRTQEATTRELRNFTEEHMAEAGDRDRSIAGLLSTAQRNQQQISQLTELVEKSDRRQMTHQRDNRRHVRTT